ncbi:MAG: hypothetical protein VW378_03345 [bacterium]
MNGVNLAEIYGVYLSGSAQELSAFQAVKRENYSRVFRLKCGDDGCNKTREYAEYKASLDFSKVLDWIEQNLDQLGQEPFQTKVVTHFSTCLNSDNSDSTGINIDHPMCHKFLIPWLLLLIKRDDIEGLIPKLKNYNPCILRPSDIEILYPLKGDMFLEAFSMLERSIFIISVFRQSRNKGAAQNKKSVRYNDDLDCLCPEIKPGSVFCLTWMTFLIDNRNDSACLKRLLDITTNLVETMKHGVKQDNKGVSWQNIIQFGHSLIEATVTEIEVNSMLLLIRQSHPLMFPSLIANLKKIQEEIDIKNKLVQETKKEAKDKEKTRAEALHQKEFEKSEILKQKAIKIIWDTRDRFFSQHIRVLLDCRSLIGLSGELCVECDWETYCCGLDKNGEELCLFLTDNIQRFFEHQYRFEQLNELTSVLEKYAKSLEEESNLYDEHSFWRRSFLESVKELRNVIEKNNREIETYQSFKRVVLEEFCKRMGTDQELFICCTSPIEVLEPLLLRWEELIQTTSLTAEDQRDICHQLCSIEDADTQIKTFKNLITNTVYCESFFRIIVLLLDQKKVFLNSSAVGPSWLRFCLDECKSSTDLRSFEEVFVRLIGLKLDLSSCIEQVLEKYEAYQCRPLAISLRWILNQYKVSHGRFLNSLMKWLLESQDPLDRLILGKDIWFFQRISGLLKTSSIDLSMGECFRLSRFVIREPSVRELWLDCVTTYQTFCDKRVLTPDDVKCDLVFKDQGLCVVDSRSRKQHLDYLIQDNFQIIQRFRHKILENKQVNIFVKHLYQQLSDDEKALCSFDQFRRIFINTYIRLSCPQQSKFSLVVCNEKGGSGVKYLLISEELSRRSNKVVARSLNIRDVPFIERNQEGWFVNGVAYNVSSSKDLGELNLDCRFLSPRGSNQFNEGQRFFLRNERLRRECQQLFLCEGINFALYCSKHKNIIFFTNKEGFLVKLSMFSVNIHKLSDKYVSVCSTEGNVILEMVDESNCVRRLIVRGVVFNLLTGDMYQALYDEEGGVKLPLLSFNREFPRQVLDSFFGTAPLHNGYAGSSDSSTGQMPPDYVWSSAGLLVHVVQR